MKLEAQNVASNSERKTERRDGELSDDEEIEDEFEEERGLVDGKIRRDDEYDEEYEGIQIDESVALKQCCLPFCPDCSTCTNSSDSYLAQSF